MIIKLSKKYPDVILITGDYYIDHPTFGIAIIARYLESLNLSVWIVSQPNPKNDFEIFKKLPEPKLFFGITSGNIDSTLNLYTVNKVKRVENAYSPKENDVRIRNALITYTNKIRSLFKKSLIIIGGLEASLRRFAHYDYFDDKIRPSILEECNADILVYGQGEKTIKQIYEAIIEKKDLKNIKGTAVRVKNIQDNDKNVILEDFENLNEKNFEEYTKIIYKYSQDESPFTLYQKQRKHIIKYNPHQSLLTEEELDKIYALKYTYSPLPKTDSFIKAYETVRNTVVTHRGCSGGCSFCSITIHQGKKIVSRSEKNILEEIKRRKLKVISDLQAPTANLYSAICENKNYCYKTSCLFPKKCRFLKLNEEKYIKLIKNIKKIVKKVYIASGIRYDILSEKTLDFLVKENLISGQLKIAPEHTDDEILKKMKKPSFKKFTEFIDLFKKITKKYGKKFYVIPYIISAYPGANEKNTLKLKNDLIKLLGFVPLQIQDFTPTPSTYATAQFLKNKKIARIRKKLRKILQGSYGGKKRRNQNKTNKKRS